MKRIRLGVGKKALAVFASLAVGAGTFAGCIPDPDISGLPPFDASIAPGFDANALNVLEAGSDAPVNGEAGDDGGSNDAPGATAIITGVVINFTQGNGRGVVPGATVTVVNGPTTTTDAFGAFVLAGVPAGQALVNVSKATDKTAGIAYSTTQVVLTLAGNEIVSLFPVLHEGCSATQTMPAAGAVTTSSCGPFGNQAGVLAQLQYGAASFTEPSTGGIFHGTARIEIIPVAFPFNGESGTDFTWALGLPGANTPVETIGAAEFRVIDDSTGEPLKVNDNNVVATVPTWQAANTTNDKPYFYDGTAGAWTADATGETLVANSTTENGDGPDFNVVDIDQVQALGWLGVTNAGVPTTCVTGSVTANGAPAAGVWVRGTGLNFFGVSSAISDGNGTFCLDVKAAPAADASGATPEVGIAAGYASTSGVFFSLPTASYAVSALGGGTCATQAGCSVLGPIALTPFNSTCLNGILTPSGDNALPSTVNVFLDLGELNADETADGIQSTAYIGTAGVSDAGVFCATATAGSIEVFDSVTGCYSQPMTALSGGAATTCGGGGCTDAGTVPLNGCP